MIASTIEQKR